MPYEFINTFTERSEKQFQKSERTGRRITAGLYGEIYNEKVCGNPQISYTVDLCSEWPSAKIFNYTETKTVTKFLNNRFNIYGVPKTVRFVDDTALKTKNFSEFCQKVDMKSIPGLP